jgi:hypothetical protein
LERGNKAAQQAELDVMQKELTPGPESGSVQWNIVDNSGEVVHTFWNRNVQADADQASLEWLRAHWEDGIAGLGPFATVPADTLCIESVLVPGSVNLTSAVESIPLYAVSAVPNEFLQAIS